MKTNEYLDLVKAKLRLPSDYALRIPLGLSKQQVSAYRNRGDVLNDEIAMKVAEITGIPAEKIIFDCYMERAKTPELKAFWASVLENFSALKPGFDFLMPHGLSAFKSMVYQRAA